MRISLGLLVVLMICCLSSGKKLSTANTILLPTPDVESQGGIAPTQKPETVDEEGEHDLTAKSDIWDELRNLRDMVVVQTVELRYLTTRVTAAESLVEALQKENEAIDARMISAESLAQALQVENEAQALDLAIAQQKISNLQQSLTASEHHVEQLKAQQEGQMTAVQELQNANTVRQVAFSASLRSSGEGNICNKEEIQLIFTNVFTNVGNRYNPHTGYFTAPVRGVYYFRFTGHIAHSDSGTRIRLVKNGNSVVVAGDRATESSLDAEDNVSNGVVLHLGAGDVVSLQMQVCVWDDHFHRTTFSGFLLFPW